jgi:hypothetical protein
MNGSMAELISPAGAKFEFILAFPAFHPSICAFVQCPSPLPPRADTSFRLVVEECMCVCEKLHSRIIRNDYFLMEFVDFLVLCCSITRIRSRAECRKHYRAASSARESVRAVSNRSRQTCVRRRVVMLFTNPGALGVTLQISCFPERRSHLQ